MVFIFNRIKWLLNLFFITLLMFFLSKVITTYIKSRLEVRKAYRLEPVETHPVQKETKPFSYYSIIGERDIFNMPPPPAPKTSEILNNKPKEIPVTKLNLGLLGTVTSKNKKASYAIIENRATREENIYRIGDIIEMDVSVIDIERNKVIINNKGYIETLVAFADGKIDNNTPSAPQPLPPLAGYRPEMDALYNKSKGHIEQISPNQWRVSREEINNVLGNVNQIMSQALLRPYFEEGKPAGFRVSQIMRGSILEDIGIANGDVIKSVNGMNIKTPEDVFEAYTHFKTENVIRLDIMRNNQPQTFVYNIQ